MTGRMKWVLIACVFTIAGCSKNPDVPTNQPDEALPYRSATATEVFNLRSQCAKLGDAILDDSFIGAALNKDVATHYNPKTNRCYAQVTVQPIDLAHSDISSYLYDGQTKEMLAYHTTKDGKKSFMNLAMLPTGGAPGVQVDAEQQVLDAINLAMNDDRKN